LLTTLSNPTHIDLSQRAQNLRETLLWIGERPIQSIRLDLILLLEE